MWVMCVCVAVVWQSKMRMSMPIMTTERTVINQSMVMPIAVRLIVAMVSVWLLVSMYRVVRPVP